MSHNREIIKPKALTPGDTVIFVAPSRAYPEDQAHRITKATEALEARGYKVLHQPNLTTKYRGFLNAPDEERARLLMEAYEDPEIDAIFPITGGYSATRMIRFLDYDKIRANPKILIGYSDITALHCAIEAKAGIISYHAPFPTSMYLKRDDGSTKDFPIHHFWETLESTSWESRTGDLVMPELPMKNQIELISNPDSMKATGRLTGGNLSLIHALHGTEYLADSDGKIFFFEDIGEEPYRLDRMLSQLENGGYFENLSGVVIGQMWKCETDNPERSLTLREVMEDYFAHRDYPVFYNFPVGHVNENVPMPNGALVEMDAENLTIRFVEPPVTLN